MGRYQNIFKQLHFPKAARRAAGLDDDDGAGDIFNEEHDEDLLF